MLCVLCCREETSTTPKIMERAVGADLALKVGRVNDGAQNLVFTTKSIYEEIQIKLKTWSSRTVGGYL